MLSCFIDRTLKACADEPFIGRFAAFSLLFSLPFSTACGGGSKSFSSTIPSNAAIENLNIAGNLPAGAVGANYSGSVSVTGGAAPYSFAVVSGQLPNGVGLAKDSGAISGTPSSAGTFNFVVSALDSKGTSNQKSLQIPVSNNSTSSSGGGANSNGTSSSAGNSNNGVLNNGTTNGKVFSNIQQAGGWAQFGQGPPDFVDCSPSPCNGITFGMQQGVNNPSKSGSATQFTIGGSTPYSDALWNNHVIGPFSSQGTFDGDGSIVPSVYNFTYDADFYGDNLGLAEALEFDINQFFNGMGFIYGHECRIAAGNQWAVWDDKDAKWVPTGVPCYPNSNSWNHVTLKVQRTSDNHLTYQSITLNGQTTTLNWTFDHGSASNWYGVVLNYQMDGNYQQDSYSTYLDNLTLTYQ
ncbi:MAG TPA: Ig domain-containing protein [Candidatus Sulfotelmatobacter sp.]|nr:Ig domain-containing protein [Candidatus Sulfotelmatobacter sp.]